MKKHKVILTEQANMTTLKASAAPDSGEGMPGFDYAVLADWLEERAHSIRRTEADMKMYQRCIDALRHALFLRERRG